MLATLSLCATTLLLGAEAQPNQVKKPAAATAAKPPAKISLLAIEKNVVEKTNAQRAAAGLPPLEVDHDLMKSARAHCTWMTLNQSMQHTNQPVAENIAMGQQDSEEVVNCWMRSSGHRANIMNPGHRRIGVGVYRTVTGTIFWCQQFRH